MKPRRRVIGGRTGAITALAVLTMIAVPSSVGAAAREGSVASAHSGKSPVVTKVSPKSGTSWGNTVVTISGTNLAGATSVTFGPRYQAAIVADSSTRLTVIDPPGGEYLGTGPVDVIITLPNSHSSPISKSDHFTYVAGPGKFPSAITGTFTDNFTFGNDDGLIPPAETSTSGNFTLAYNPDSCASEPTSGLDVACYGATSVSGTGLQACYPPDDGSATLEPFSFGLDQIDVTARIQVDAAGVYHLYFDFFAPSAANGPISCPAYYHSQNSVIRLFHDPDALNTASADAYAVGQGSETVNVQDNGDDGDYGDGITAAGWSGTGTFAFSYGSNPVVSGSPAGGTVGIEYLDKSITVSGGTSPYTVTATGLPPGLTIKASGTISGTPTAAGSYAPTITATDSSKPPKTGTETPTIVISPGSPTVTLSASPASPQAPATTLTLTAEITGTVSGTPDKGTISLTSDGNAIACTATKVAKNKLTCTTTAGALGATGLHSLVASVAADTNYQSAASTPLPYRVK